MQKEKQKYRVPFIIAVLIVTLAIGFFVMVTKRADTVESIVLSFEQQFSENVIFGYSEQGREIKGYTFGNGEDRLLLIAGLHGNEKGATDLLEKLSEEIRVHPDLVAPEKQIIILPIANPDGYYAREDKLNANGVNLNRNFATTEWSQYQEEIFGGSQPFSEAESRVIEAIVREYQPVIMIAFHSQGALTVPENGHAASIDLAAWYAEKTGYTYFDAWDYSGTATGWFTETTGNPSLTVELTSHDESDWDINKDALLELVSRVRTW